MLKALEKYVYGGTDSLPCGRGGAREGAAIPLTPSMSFKYLQDKCQTVHLKNKQPIIFGPQHATHTMYLSSRPLEAFHPK